MTNVRPKLNGQGRLATPEPLLQDLFDVTGMPFAGTKTIIFKGWMLTNRDVREIGPLFEVTDSHSIVIVRQ